MIESPRSLLGARAILPLLCAFAAFLAGCATPEYQSREDLTDRAFVKFSYSGVSVLSGVGRIYALENGWLCGSSWWKNKRQTAFIESNGLASISLNRQGVWIPAGTKFEFALMSAQDMESCLLIGSFTPKSGLTYQIKGFHRVFPAWDHQCTLEVFEVAAVASNSGEEARPVEDFKLEQCRNEES